MISDSGVAEPRLGATPPDHTDHDSTQRGWYSRGYLPHCDHPGLLQAITYRLADSLPPAALERMEDEVRYLPPERRDGERRKRIEEWLDAGHGCCVLREPEAARCVVDTWQHFAGLRYDLIAWVVMPNHVHVLIRTYEGVSLAKIVQSWKSYTGRRIGAMMEESRAGLEESQAGSEESRAGLEESRAGLERSRAGAQRSQGGQSEGRRSQGGRSRVKGVWMREYWDRYVRNERHFQATVRYIHDNPVKAGLVSKAEDWPWSSAREYVGVAEVGRAELGLGDPGGSGGSWLGLAGHQAGPRGEQEQ